MCEPVYMQVREELVVKTNSQRALDARRRVVELIVSNHSKEFVYLVSVIQIASYKDYVKN